MKKIVFLIMMMFLVVSVYSGGLNNSADSLKENHADIYGAIRTRAVSEWGNDHSMVVYEINRQSNALYEAASLLEDYPKITTAALMEWSDVSLSGVANIFVCSVDWVMVVYEAKRQIESQGNY